MARAVLCFDVGGSHLKAAVISTRGKFLDAPLRVKTPLAREPAAIVSLLTKMAGSLRGFDRVTIGFPGMIKDGTVVSAPNFGTRDWEGFKLAAALHQRLKKPVLLLNDADVQGLAVIRGKGLELVCTLGTGLGTAWFRQGELMPHMDLTHLALHKKHDFDMLLGEKARRRIGRARWEARVKKLIAVLKTVCNYDHLYLGGGNGRLIGFRLPKDVSLVSNDAGMEGGAFAWRRK